MLFSDVLMLVLVCPETFRIVRCGPEGEEHKGHEYQLDPHLYLCLVLLVVML